MDFLWPSTLWLLILVPTLLLAYVLALRRRRKYTLRYASLMVVSQAQGQNQNHLRHVPPTLFTLGIGIALIALARPVTIVPVAQQGRTIILTFDVSASMRTPDLKPTRLGAAQAAAEKFLELQPKDVRIGVVAFSESADVVQVPTVDHDKVLAAIERLKLQDSTAIGTGILTSLNAILSFYRGGFPSDPAKIGAVAPGAHVPAAIILLTDGRNVDGPDPVGSAKKAADYGIGVYTVGIGKRSSENTEGFNSDTSSFLELDEPTLNKIADATHAKYYYAGDEVTLSGIYQTLGSQIVIEPQRIEITSYFAAVAIGITLLCGVASFLWSGSLP